MVSCASAASRTAPNISTKLLISWRKGKSKRSRAFGTDLGGGLDDIRKAATQTGLVLMKCDREYFHPSVAYGEPAIMRCRRPCCCITLPPNALRCDRICDRCMISGRHHHSATTLAPFAAPAGGRVAQISPQLLPVPSCLGIALLPECFQRALTRRCANGESRPAILLCISRAWLSVLWLVKFQSVALRIYKVPGHFL